MTYYVITAFVAPADCQAVAVGMSASEALDKWQTWILNGETLESCTAEACAWIMTAKSDMRNYGKSAPQDSGCHYRLEHCY